MTRSLSAVRLTVLALMLLCAGPLMAQVLPLDVQVAGNVASVRIGTAQAPVAEMTLGFDAATNLGAASLGISARLLSARELILLRRRLPSGTLTQVDGAFPLLLTVEPPSSGGLAFDRTVRVEIHTHALAYTVGSEYRVFKAPLGGAFRDITDDVSPGSVRARGTTGGFSQFLVLADLRSTSVVIAGKVAGLRAQVATLPAAEAAPLTALLDTAESAVAAADYPAAVNALDGFRARVSARAGIAIPQQWRALRDLDNTAGELLAGAASLKFSVGFLRDYGN